MAKPDRPLGREHRRHSTVPGRQDAVEHVDAGGDRHDDVPLVADPHQISGPIFRKTGGGEFDDFTDQFRALADRHAADRVSGQVEAADPVDRRRASVEIGSALNDAEKRLLVRSLVGPDAPLKPADGAFVGGPKPLLPVLRSRDPRSGTPRSVAGVGRRWAVVESHDDVGADRVLDRHRGLGAEMDAGAVDERLEGHPVLVDRVDVRHRERLIAAGIGEDRSVPTHEPMTTAESFEQFGPRPEHQVVGVVEQDLGAGVPHLRGQDALHRGRGGDGHERRRVEITVRRGDDAGPRRIRRTAGLDLESQRPAQRRDASRRIFFSFAVRLCSPSAWIFARIRSISTSDTFEPPEPRTLPAR